MRIPKLALATALAASVLVLPVAKAAAAVPTSSEHIITTLYAYPTLASWTQVEASAPTVSASIVDLCAADGTGSGCDGMPWDEQPPAAWTTTIANLQNAGITPLVYIATDYGDQGGGSAFTVSTVESEVSQAVGWYGKNIGFMFDEGATTCALESSYLCSVCVFQTDTCSQRAFRSGRRRASLRFRVVEPSRPASESCLSHPMPPRP
jgi:hypothetical protein